MLAPLSLQFQSLLYNNIKYSVIARTFQQDTGNLNHMLLKHNISVSCYINVSTAALVEYEHAIITVAYKQTSSKAKRYKPALANRASSSVIYRDNLEADLAEYKSKPITENSAAVKAFLLNDLSSINDKSIGDTGIQCMFRFQKFDGSSEFTLAPGATLGQLTSVVGLSVFEAASIEEVLESMIGELTTLLEQYVIPQSGLEQTLCLNEDIKRYLKFCFYGE